MASASASVAPIRRGLARLMPIPAVAGEPWLRGVPWHLAVAFAYLAFSHLGLHPDAANPMQAALLPPAGFALAVFLLYGSASWPGILLGALLAALWARRPLPAAVLIASGAVLAAAAGHAALRRIGFSARLERVRDVLWLVVLGGLLTPVISSSLHVIGEWAARGSPLHDAWLLDWVALWRGHVIGVLVVTPLLLIWCARQTVRLAPTTRLERWIFFLSLVGVGAFLLRRTTSYEYALFIFVAWAAMRVGLRGASAAVALVAAMTVSYAMHGNGPFVVEPAMLGVARLQLFLALLSTGGLLLAVLVTGYGRLTAALAADELRFRRVFWHAGVGIGEMGEGGILTASNPTMARIFECDSGRECPVPLLELVHPDDLATDGDTLRELIGGQRTACRLELRFRRRDGSYFPARLLGTRLPQERGEAPTIIAVVEDLSEQRAAEEALRADIVERRASEERLRQATETLATLIDAAPLAIYALDPSGRVRQWNPAAEQIFGWQASEVIGRVLPPVPEESLEEFQDLVRRVCGGEVVDGLQVQRRSRDGARLYMRVHAAATHLPDGTVDGLIMLSEDVTERRRLGEQLRQAQKMEAVGQLAGGIAHDFNNLLTIILTNAELLAAEQRNALGETRAEWTELRQATLHGAALVRKLLAYSRQRPLSLRIIDVADIVAGIEQPMRRLLGGSVEIVVERGGKGSTTIRGDDGAIEQMLFNLATNARDALPEEGGRITLRVTRMALDGANPRERGLGEAGEHVVMEMRDNGSGMSPEVQAQLFEPFFTTKDVNKGTGLGMAMVYGLAKQHDGFIDVSSAPGKGTRIRVYFPAVAGPATRTPPTGTAALTAEEAGGGTERILVVDDDRGVREATMRVLALRGYQVEGAAGGAEALAAIQGASAPFDLLLTDLAMPRMSGLQLYEQLRAAGSDLPVVLMTGKAPEDIGARVAAASALAVLHKPWSLPDLLTRVRASIAQRAPGSPR